MKSFDEYDSRFDKARKGIEEDRIFRLIDKLKEARENDRIILIMGNGGSLTTASHFMEDLNKCPVKDPYDINEKRFKAIALSDASALTAYGNDMAYKEVFGQQVLNYLRKGDLEIVISASGNSCNILNAVDAANRIGAYTFGLLGFDGGKAIEVLNDYVLVPTDKGDYRVAEDHHLQIVHKVIEYFMHE